MKVQVNFEIETDPFDEQQFKNFIYLWADEQECRLRHKIKLDYTSDDLDEIFVKYEVNKID